MNIEKLYKTSYFAFKKRFNMTRIILETNNNNDVLLIKEIADRLKIKYELQSIPETELKEKLEHYYKVIKKGADVSNYGDPSLWQKKVREDRNITLP
jgi:hypothetical protein